MSIKTSKFSWGLSHNPHDFPMRFPPFSTENSQPSVSRAEPFEPLRSFWRFKSTTCGALVKICYPSMVMAYGSKLQICFNIELSLFIKFTIQLLGIIGVPNFDPSIDQSLVSPGYHGIPFSDPRIDQISWLEIPKIQNWSQICLSLSSIITY